MQAIERVGVIGAGTMGNGIAQACATAGIDVVMIDVAQPALDGGVAAIGASLERLQKKDKITADARSAALTRFPSGKKSPSGTERDDHHAIAITLAAGPGSFVTIPGGFPVMVDGRCVGAVGASGASKNDIDIAQAGIAAFEQS